MSLTLIPVFVRPLYVLEFHRKLGPLIRSIYNMAMDVFLFLLMWSVVLLAFAVAFGLLFWEVCPGLDDPDNILISVAPSDGSFSYTTGNDPTVEATLGMSFTGDVAVYDCEDSPYGTNGNRFVVLMSSCLNCMA